MTALVLKVYHKVLPSKSSNAALSRKRPDRVCQHPAEPDRNPETLEGHRIMAKGKATTAKARPASVAKITLQDRPHFNVMDHLNQAIADLRGTVQALYHIDTHINDREDNDACRTVLSRLLMADMGMVEDAERRAWAEIIVRKGGAQ